MSYSAIDNDKAPLLCSPNNFYNRFNDCGACMYFFLPSLESRINSHLPDLNSSSRHEQDHHYLPPLITPPSFTKMAGLVPYKADFLQAALEGGVLKFGSFELKSKRVSPYFFNAGDFYTAKLQNAIGTAFGKAIIEARQQFTGFDFDVVFGPAYKGIPLATLTNLKLGELDPVSHADTLCSFDRKEAKDHGEGGNIVGAPLKGKRVLIVDDVITAGTAKREAIQKIRQEGGTVAGIVVALDRMEKLTSPDGDDTKAMPSAMGELRKELGVPVFAIITLNDIIDGVKSKNLASADTIRSIEEYRATYKASD